MTVLRKACSSEVAVLLSLCINSIEAPRVAKKGTTKKMQASQATIAGLEPGKVARIKPGPEENLRGLKVSLMRAARSLNRGVTIWDVDGVIYVELADR